jgi:hypothetical protein
VELAGTCSTTNTAAGSLFGRRPISCTSASTPPADAPITMMSRVAMPSPCASAPPASDTSSSGFPMSTDVHWMRKIGVGSGGPSSLDARGSFGGLVRGLWTLASNRVAVQGVSARRAHAVGVVHAGRERRGLRDCAPLSLGRAQPRTPSAMCDPRDLVVAHLARVPPRSTLCHRGARLPVTRSDGHGD